MRLTHVLRAQHLGFMTKRHWLVQGKRTIRETGARAALEARGIEVVDALDVIAPPKLYTDLGKLVPYIPREPVFDSTHSCWHDRKCYMYGDTNVLLEGVPQAQVLTNTLDIQELPETLHNSFEKSIINEQTDRSIRNAIMSSYVFDAEQKKLPKRKVPDRPAFNLPRDYGITDLRKFRLLTAKMIRECETLAGRTKNAMRKILDDALFVVPLNRDDDLIEFEVTAETFMTSKKPIGPIQPNLNAFNVELPNLFPLKCTISMPHENLYQIRDFYPIQRTSPFGNPHTIFLYFSTENTINLHRTDVTLSQFKSRSMLKSFAAAAASGRAQYGENVKDLPHPIVVQSIQTNGKQFYFGVYQLNTLEINGSSGTRNYWFNIPPIDLYAECLYKDGRPILDGYNSDVFKYLYAFYRNG